MGLESTYKAGVTWQKFLLWAGIGSAAGAVGSGDLVELLKWLYEGVAGSGFSDSSVVKDFLWNLLTGALTGGVAALKNWWKNADKVKYLPGVIIGPLLIGAAAVALQGCAGLGLPNTLSKPVEHETKLNITQPPTMNPDGTLVQGETTEYYKKWRGGAGVESTKSDNLRMGIDKDGNWYVEQGEASQLSTQGQVQGIVEGMQLNLQAIMAGYALGSQGINVAAPIIGQKLQFDADDKARDDANSAARDAQVLQFLEQLSKRLSKIEAAQPKPAAPPADSPLVDVPVTLQEVGVSP